MHHTHTTPRHATPRHLPRQGRYKYVDDLATVWCEWGEMELRHKNYRAALDVMRRATATPARPRTREVRQHPTLPDCLPRWRPVLLVSGLGRGIAWAVGEAGLALEARPAAARVRSAQHTCAQGHPHTWAHACARPSTPTHSLFPPCSPFYTQEESKLPVQDRLYRSLRCWTLLADLEESLGTPEGARAVYERILDLRIATPQASNKPASQPAKQAGQPASQPSSPCLGGCRGCWRGAGWPRGPAETGAGGSPRWTRPAVTKMVRPFLHRPHSFLQIVLNYALLLQESKYWEDSFRCWRSQGRRLPLRLGTACR